MSLYVSGFDCRCGNMFCGIHRYSDVHNCTFDYKTDGAEKIRKENPVVVGEKITKIWVGAPGQNLGVFFPPDFSSPLSHIAQWTSEQYQHIPLNHTHHTWVHFFVCLFFNVFLLWIYHYCCVKMLQKSRFIQLYYILISMTNRAMVRLLEGRVFSQVYKQRLHVKQAKIFFFR